MARKRQQHPTPATPRPQDYAATLNMLEALAIVERTVAPYRTNKHGKNATSPSHNMTESVTTTASEAWDKGMGFEAALAASKQGLPAYSAAVEALAEKVTGVLDVETPRAAACFRDEGEDVSVDRFLDGEDYVFNARTRGPKRRAVRVVIQTGAAWFVEAAALARRGACAIALATVLERRGIAVELAARLTSEAQNGVRVRFTLPLKQAGDAWDADAVAFTGHPAFMRRIGFALMESLPAAYHPLFCGGYGRPIDDASGAEIYFERISRDNMKHWESDEAAVERTRVMLEEALARTPAE